MIEEMDDEAEAELEEVDLALPAVTPKNGRPPPLPAGGLSASGASSPVPLPSPPVGAAPPSGAAVPLAPSLPGTRPPVGRFNSGVPLAPPRPSSSVVPRAAGVPRIAPPAPAPPPEPVIEEKDPVAELKDQLEAVRRAVLAKDTEVHLIVAQRDARIAELEAARSELAARQEEIDELERLLLASEAKVRELTQELESLREKASRAGDDLKLIKGIGPAFERELRKLGVDSFAQIAAWSAADIEQIAPKIKARPERIRRDDWVRRAAELVAQKG